MCSHTVFLPQPDIISPFDYFFLVARISLEKPPTFRSGVKEKRKEHGHDLELISGLRLKEEGSRYGYVAYNLTFLKAKNLITLQSGQSFLFYPLVVGPNTSFSSQEGGGGQFHLAFA